MARRQKAAGMLADERTLVVVTSTPTLTSLAKAGGCAAKYPAARLETLLAGLVPADAADLLVGLAPSDDAAVYRLDDERALVATVDFFPPLVDDPADYGAIAAANALNDVFAMGGAAARSRCPWPHFPEELPGEARGGRPRGRGGDRAQRRARVLAGGHTLRDDEPKFGLAVVGTVHPGRRSGRRRRAAGRRAVPDQAARHGARSCTAPSAGSTPAGALEAAMRLDAAA